MKRLQSISILVCCWVGLSSVVYLPPAVIAQSEVTAENEEAARARSLALSQRVTELYQQGLYAEAIPLAQEALSLDEGVLGEVHPDVATSLNNLAGLYYAQGNYSEALPLFERALSIYESTIGHDHPDIAASLNNLALLYQAQGNYSEALPLLERALLLMESAMGDSHPHVARSLNNLAALYQAQGNYRDALPLYERAWSIYESTMDYNHPNVAHLVSNLALLYQAHGDYREALPLFERALTILESTLGSNHPDIAASLSALAGLYQAQGNHSKALPLYERALALLESTIGNDHPNIVRSLQNLANLYQEQGIYSEALPLLEQALSIEENNLSVLLSSASETRRQRYINMLAISTSSTLSFHLNDQPHSPEAASLALSTVLRRKGRVLDATSTSLQQLITQLTPENKVILEELNTVRSQIANLFNNVGNRSESQYQAELASLEVTAGALEEQLSRSSAAFRVETAPVTVESIKTALPTNTALIEFVRYTHFEAAAERSNRWGHQRYAAYVLTNTGNIQAIDLGEAAALNAQVAEFQRALSSRSASIKTVARNLDKAIMEPLRPFLEDNTHLLISPDSHLNLIPFDALVDENNNYLINNYQISYLTSGRDLLKFQIDTPSKQAPFILANPDYGEPTTDQAKVDTEQGTNSANQRSVDGDGLKFFPLEGTAAEAAAIAPLLPNATLLTESEATESRLKQVEAPSILHIATHGFFLPDVEFIPQPSPDDGPNRAASLDVTYSDDAPTQVTPSNLENPLLRSGLALAGANTRSNGSEDGIFTALEASGLNLHGTQLVVLSACDTGVGAASAGEGVYGLRRAFVIAGAESQLMSLWQVSDSGTSELMQLYYQNLMEQGQGRSEALRNAQIEMMNTGTYEHPYYWASFIFSGDWRPLD